MEGRKRITFWFVVVGIVVVVSAGIAGHQYIWEQWLIYNLSVTSKRQWAITQLGDMRSARAIPKLIDCIPLCAEDYRLRHQLRYAFTKIGKPAVAPLLHKLREGPGRTREFVAVAIGHHYHIAFRSGRILRPEEYEAETKLLLMRWLKKMVVEGTEEEAILRAAAEALSALEVEDRS